MRLTEPVDLMRFAAPFPTQLNATVLKVLKEILPQSKDVQGDHSTVVAPVIVPKVASVSEASALFLATIPPNALGVNDAKITCAVRSVTKIRTAKLERCVLKAPAIQDVAPTRIVRMLKFAFRTSVAVVLDLILDQLDVVTLMNAI